MVVFNAFGDKGMRPSGTIQYSDIQRIRCLVYMIMFTLLCWKVDHSEQQVISLMKKPSSICTAGMREGDDGSNHRRDGSHVFTSFLFCFCCIQKYLILKLRKIIEWMV